MLFFQGPVTCNADNQVTRHTASFAGHCDLARSIAGPDVPQPVLRWKRCRIGGTIAEALRPTPSDQKPSFSPATSRLQDTCKNPR